MNKTVMDQEVITVTEVDYENREITIRRGTRAIETQAVETESIPIPAHFEIYFEMAVSGRSRSKKARKRTHSRPGARRRAQRRS